MCIDCTTPSGGQPPPLTPLVSASVEEDVDGLITAPTTVSSSVVSSTFTTLARREGGSNYHLRILGFASLPVKDDVGVGSCLTITFTSQSISLDFAISGPAAPHVEDHVQIDTR